MSWALSSSSAVVIPGTMRAVDCTPLKYVARGVASGPRTPSVRVARNTTCDVREGDIVDPMARPPIRFTRTDYEQLPEHIHAELIEGDLVVIPAPTHWHEGLAAELLAAVRVHFGPKGRMRVLGSHFDVSVHEGGEESILLPDVAVLPDASKATGTAWKATTPMWVAEVLSPSTAARDRGVKLRLYALAGVQEAWIVDPEAETVEVHDLKGGSKRVFAHGARAESHVVPGFRVDIAAFFAVDT